MNLVKCIVLLSPPSSLKQSMEASSLFETWAPSKRALSQHCAAQLTLTEFLWWGWGPDWSSSPTSHCCCCCWMSWPSLSNALGLPNHFHLQQEWTPATIGFICSGQLTRIPLILYMYGSSPVRQRTLLLFVFMTNKTSITDVIKDHGYRGCTVAGTEDWTVPLKRCYHCKAQ